MQHTAIRRGKQWSPEEVTALSNMGLDPKKPWPGDSVMIITRVVGRYQESANAQALDIHQRLFLLEVKANGDHILTAENDITRSIIVRDEHLVVVLRGGAWSAKHASR